MVARRRKLKADGSPDAAKERDQNTVRIIEGLLDNKELPVRLS